MGTSQIDRVLTVFVTTSVLGTMALSAAVITDLRNRDQVQQPTSQIVALPSGFPASLGPTPSAPTDSGSGSGGGYNGGGSTSTTTSSGGGTVGALSNTAAGSGIRNGNIYVGGIYDMTGPVNSDVERDTVRAYFRKVNDAGGINGLKLQLIPCDGYYDPTVSRNCENQMVDNNVLAMVGNTFPRAEDDGVPFLASKGIPMVGGLGTPNEYASPLSFPVSPSFAFGGKGLADIFQRNGFKHPAILYIGDVPWVQPVLEQILGALAADKIYPTHVEKASATNDPDYTNHVAAMAGPADYTAPDGTKGTCASPPEEVGFCPDSVIAATDPFSYSKLFQAMDRANWHPPIVAGGVDKGNEQIDYGDQLDRAQSLTPFVSPLDPAEQSNSTVQDYLSTVRHYYPNQIPALDVYTQIAWTSAALFVQAVRDAGPNLTRATLVQALDNIRNFKTGWSTDLSYGPGNHDPNHCYYFLKHDNTEAKYGGTWRQDSTLHCY